MKRNSGELVKTIALRRGLPYVTVETIIRDYLKSKEDDLVIRGRANIEGIASLTRVENIDSGDMTVRGRVSDALRQKVIKRMSIKEQKMG